MMTAAILMVLISIMAVTGVVATRYEEDAPPRGCKAWICLIAYWMLTLPLAFEITAGSLWDLFRIEYVREMLTHLGYPLYLLYILGAPRIPCALVLLTPRFPRLKEWAYAGAFFDYAGASASHWLNGDRGSQWIVPLVFSAFTLASWALRPASRRLPRLAPAKEMHIVSWSVPVLMVVAMLVFAFFTLPKGAPSQ